MLVLEDRSSPYLAFHAALTGLDAIHVRGYAPRLLRAVFGERDPRYGETAESIAWIDGELPSALNLGNVRAQIGALDVRFAALPERNALRDDHVGDHVEMTLSRMAMRRLASGLAVTQNDVEIRETEQRIDGYLQDWLFGETRRIAPRGSDLYVAPDLFELLFFDEEILTPLLAVLTTGYADGDWLPAGVTALE